MTSRMIQRVGASALAPVLMVRGALLLSPSAATAQTPAHTPSPAERAGAGELSDSETNRLLDELARRLAVAVENAELRQTIHDAVGERFDGDTNALWSSLAENPAFNRMVAAGGARTRPSVQARQRVADVASSIARLQVAVPVKFGSWDPATYEPLVAYFPQGVDDTTLKTVTAYDSAGNAKQIDAQVGPDRPVIVLSLNERTDDDGNLLPRYKGGPKVEKAGGSARALASSYTVVMEGSKLLVDNEPALLGDAEISMKARSRGCSGVDYLETNWPLLNNDGDIWAGPLHIGSTTCDVVFRWWEDDGGAFNFELTWGGFGLGVGMDNDDDIMSGIQLAHSTFQYASPDLTQWSDITMSTS